MSENVRLDALALAVAYHQSEQSPVFVSTIVETAESFRLFLEDKKVEHRYWRFLDGSNIWYRAKGAGPDAPLERGTLSGWSNKYSPSNPQSAGAIDLREDYALTPASQVPAYLRSDD